MRKLVLFLLTLSVGLGATQPCWGLYVMVRSGFGKLRGKRQGKFQQEDSSRQQYFVHNSRCIQFSYENYQNLSLILGTTADVFKNSSLGLELEILGGYARIYTPKKRSRNTGGILNIERPYILYLKTQRLADDPHHRLNSIRCFYPKDQRILGAQVNIYWEQTLLERLSVGLGGGLGGACVQTKFTILGWWRKQYMPNVYYNGGIHSWRKYVHTGAFMWNFTSFVRYEAFGLLFEGGYRHISLHQMIDNKVYRHFTIKKLADLQSDQLYFGVGRRF